MSRKFSLVPGPTVYLLSGGGRHCSCFPGARLEGPEGPSEVVLVQSQTLQAQTGVTNTFTN